MSPRANRHRGARAGGRNFSLQPVPHLWWLGAPNYTHVTFPGTGFSLGSFPLKGIAFSHPFRLILPVCVGRERVFLLPFDSG